MAQKFVDFHDRFAWWRPARPRSAALSNLAGRRLTKVRPTASSSEWARVDQFPQLHGLSSSAGMATISFDFSLTFTCPSTMRCRAAKAETMWIASIEPFV